MFSLLLPTSNSLPSCLHSRRNKLISPLTRALCFALFSLSCTNDRRRRTQLVPKRQKKDYHVLLSVFLPPSPWGLNICVCMFSFFSRPICIHWRVRTWLHEKRVLCGKRKLFFSSSWPQTLLTTRKLNGISIAVKKFGRKVNFLMLQQKKKKNHQNAISNSFTQIETLYSLH